MGRILHLVRALGIHGAVANARAELELDAGRAAQVALVARRVNRTLTASSERPLVGGPVHRPVAHAA